MPELRLLNAERTREKLTVAQERHIRRLYREALAEVQEWSKRLEGRDNISSILRRQYLDRMEKELTEAMEHIGSDTEKLIRSNISMTATAVVKDTNRMLNNMGIGLSTAYSFVPADVVQAITMGKIYDGDWTLSKAIWSNTKKSQKDIHDIIAKGVLENKSSYDIAKELEKYVNPSAAKPWDWGKIYPGTAKKVDYNAQRLARTLVSHAYQQSFVRTTKDNPFFEGYRWLISGHDVCPICTDYAYDDHTGGKLPEGVFYKDELPMDHPNGRCTFSVYTEHSTDDIVDSLLDWAHGGENAELDKFAESLFPSKFGMIKEQIKLATTVNSLSVQNLPKVSLQESSDDWFEYENANLMSEYIRTGKMSSVDINGMPVSPEQQAILKSEALTLQEAASTTVTNYRTLYRGMVLHSEESVVDFARNSIYNIETLTATATDKGIAKIYTDTENAGGGIPVLLEIENPKGIKGFDRDGIEVILPKGSAYRVSQSFYDEDGLLHVRLYAGKGLG